MPSWWDRFGQEWAKQGLTDDPTFAQGDAGWAFIGQAPPTVEQFNSTMQWNDNKDNWLYGQIANCVIGSGQVPNSNDLMQLWNAIKSLQRRKLDVDTAFYVDAINGNDSTGTGDTGSPWKTIQHAIDYIYTYIDVSGRNCVIQLAPGTYTPFSHSQSINGQMIVQGDPLNPRAYLIKNTNGAAVVCVASAVLFLQGVAVEGNAPAQVEYTQAGIGLFLDRAGLVLYDCIAFGPCSHWHIQVGSAGYLHPMHGLSTTYSIYGGAIHHAIIIYTGFFTVARLTITLTGNPTFSGSFYAAQSHGQINGWGQTFVGTAVGKRYIVDTGAIFYAQGAAQSLPGTIAGTVDTGSFGWVY